MRLPIVHNRATRRRNQRAARRNKRSTLATITAAALALFGQMTPASADRPLDEFAVSYAYSDYDEDNLDSDDLFTGSTDRYEIESHQLSFRGPINGKLDAGFDFLYESMSGATPWWVQPGARPGDDPLQAMTGASVSDDRYDGKLYGNYFSDKGRVGSHLGFSGENDYYALYAGVDAETDFNERNTTLSSGLSFSLDEIRPTDGGRDDRISSDDKQSVNLSLGLSQVLGRKTTIQTSVSYKYSTGFLSDPYKKAYISSLAQTVPDKRPDEKHQITWLTQLRQHIEYLDASVHLDYRYYYDDWEINSHTVELSWYQNFYDGKLQIIPTFRYYSQSEADFYEAFYAAPRSDGHYSSDYRLAPFGAISFGARAQVLAEDWPGDLDWRLGFSYERYIADADLALGSVSVVNPGLVKYHHIYATIELRY